jgi:hypothetical protein
MAGSACVKHLYDHIISLRGEVWAHKTSQTTPPLFIIEVPVSTQETDRSCICVLGVLI